MPYSSIPGNERVKVYLQRILEKGMVGHSFLFGGPAGSGKKEMARSFAFELLSHGLAQKPKIRESGQHPDLHILRPEGKASLHPIERLRSFSREVFYPPHEANRKVFIIEEADRMAPTSSNALLKTFEEPSNDTVIILVSDHPSSLLPTILSRCRKINFQPPPIKEAEESKLLVDLLEAGGVNRYGDLQKATREIQQLVEKRQESEVAESRERLKERDLTAVYKGELEKEIEGQASHILHREAEALFTTVLYWYRDRHLLELGCDSRYLIHARCKATPAISLPSLIQVEKAVMEANLSVQRSYSVSLALESLLLKLGF
jgi:DNA polymerase-3 subunit delta'